jgi:peptidoglycan/LPS O-acetylase OafA/YrhL
MIWPAYLGNYARFIHPYSIGDPLQKLADFQPYGALRQGHPLFFLGHFWSLCVEEQFYLAWPWIVYWVRDRGRLLVICAATVPLCLIIRISGQLILPSWMLSNDVLNRATPFRIDALLLGGFFALAIRGQLREVLLRFARIAFPICAIVAFFFAIWIPRGHVWENPYPYPEWLFTWGLTGIDILSALMILVALQPQSLVYKVLCVRQLQWIGRISYGAYVLHDIPHMLYLKLASKLLLVIPGVWHNSESMQQQQSVLLGAVVALVSTLVLASLSFRFFESPFLRLKEKWTVRTP